MLPSATQEMGPNRIELSPSPEAVQEGVSHVYVTASGSVQCGIVRANSMGHTSPCDGLISFTDLSVATLDLATAVLNPTAITPLSKIYDMVSPNRPQGVCEHCGVPHWMTDAAADWLRKRANDEGLHEPLIVPVRDLKLTDGTLGYLQNLSVKFTGEILYRPGAFRGCRRQYREELRGALRLYDIALPRNHPLQEL